MTRIQTKELADKNRTPLWEVVPLTTPWTMYIDITNRCNFKCIYCPTGNPDMLKKAGRIQKHMPLSMYVKIVQDMRGFDKKVRIVNLYKDGEPLVRRDFTELVKILRDADVTEKIYSKTNGALIGWHKDIATAPMDMLGISVPHSNPDKIPDVVGVRVDYDKYRDDIKRLYEDSRRSFTLNAKMAFYQMTEADVEKFYHDFEPITDTVAVEGLHGWGANDLGDMLMGEDPIPHDGSPIIERLVCPLPFYMMSISSDGVTNVCCSEWGNYHRLGNVFDDTIPNLWNNDKRRAFQMMHLEGRRFENMACKDCQYRDTLPDYVDDHRLEMIERMNK
jgi:radical SAM protein with 4Fe4S-binding SPASM domain